MRSSLVIQVGAALLVGVASAACGEGGVVTSDDCQATATCGGASGAPTAGSGGKAGGGSGGEGGGTGGGGTASGGSTGNGGQGGDGGVGCEGDVAEDAACWTTNELGVFVSAETGDDTTGSGTKEAPFATIGKGITASGGKNVYVCLGATKDTYNEQLSLSAEQDGIKIYGGFDCADWTYSTTRKSLAKSPNAIGLRIAGLQEGALIENLRIEATTPSNAGESSYGAFIVESKNVVLRRVEITAADGAKGADGGAGAAGASGSQAGPAPLGKNASCDAPPQNLDGGTWADANNCGSVGGNGGQAHKNTSAGGPGSAGSPTEHIAPGNFENGGAGQVDDTTDMNGKPGKKGEAGALAMAAPSAGTFSSAGYQPADGKEGGDGYPGQGGGGGGASKGTASCVGASGGAGGMGGCGGRGGKAGRGGGASIGLFAWSSEVALVETKVRGATGGSGGDGGAGGLRGPGAKGGVGGTAMGSVTPAGNGGDGGAGGDGGSGSGGTGGPSYALVFSGTKPVFTEGDTQLTPGDGGAAGVGGEVESVKAPDGSPGAAAAELEVK